jgi:hypothetical protein
VAALTQACQNPEQQHRQALALAPDQLLQLLLVVSCCQPSAVMWLMVLLCCLLVLLPAAWLHRWRLALLVQWRSVVLPRAAARPHPATGLAGACFAGTHTLPPGTPAVQQQRKDLMCLLACDSAHFLSAYK